MENIEFELIINGNGDIARRYSFQDERLLTMRFTGEVLNYLAKTMLMLPKPWF